MGLIFDFFKILQENKTLHVHIDLKRKFQSRIFRLYIVGRQSRWDHVQGMLSGETKKNELSQNHLAL
jgi:hypothetical protein